MFLKFLEFLGRKKVVLDRGPSHPKFNEAKPWMNRYYVLFRHRPKWFPFNILIHVDVQVTGLSLTMNQGSGSALIWNEVNTGSAPITPPGWQEVAA